MTYPQHPGPPQGPYPGQQPYPGQPPYPGQQPYPAQQYPGQPGYPPPYPQSPYGMPPPKPNGATAIIAGVLAVLGGLQNLVGLIVGVVQLTGAVSVHWTYYLYLVQELLLVGTLLPGGILLFARKPIGRLLTIIGSGLAVLVTLVSVVLDVVGLWQFSAGIGGAYLGGAIVGLPLVLIPAAATLTLAIVKPTAVWCGRPTPGAAGYPPR
ncbi:hypothetical protein OG439_09395 [Amycolatopsis sp. NBC_01307]|uniref:hypothetical protein n=1 Tax=Amycolatopsis sp. NBC_01307 TaxID=2903561 RepID=UPI002E13BA79|nr:hypothetical protein OG439_09395 [Amycolatopsis sp. NBC_01307]